MMNGDDVQAGGHEDPTSGGEDDSSTERNGDDSHLHEDQKSPASSAASDSPTKVQDLAKAGRTTFDPNADPE